MTTHTHDFRITTFAGRVYAGKDALGNLPAELKRHRAKRAFIICGRSVSQKTDLIRRIQALLGDAWACPYACHRRRYLRKAWPSYWTTP